jgi:hypothetical protein
LTYQFQARLGQPIHGSASVFAGLSGMPNIHQRPEMSMVFVSESCPRQEAGSYMAMKIWRKRFFPKDSWGE